MTKLAIFASGSGSNAEKIVKYFRDNPEVDVKLIVSNNPNAFVLERAQNLGVDSHCFSRKSFYESQDLLQVLNDYQVDFIVLAGFMWLVPAYLVDAYKSKIVNIHPALLPKFGGKGMYGDHVHKAVKESAETETGITIHWVNEKYDDGNVIFQATCSISPADTPDSIAEKVHQLEYEHYPLVIESVLKKSSKNS